MKLFLQVLLISSIAAAASVAAKCWTEEPPSINIDYPAAAPVVRIQNGTIIGSRSGHVDSFKGIPYAQPPVGALRLRPPQSINRPFGTINATSLTPTACPQVQNLRLNLSSLPPELGALVEDMLELPEPQGEDCLTLSVYRPSDVTPCSRLPVGLWIYGGGFQNGATQLYDGTNLVKKSIQLGQPIVFVAINYRLGAFGFLAGKELQNEGSTNLGLRDQRLAMHWVRENIESFGGDPFKVTIVGQSAGGISVLDHMVINGGNNLYHGEPLFRGAIMDSGSIFPAHSVASSKAQAVYDQVVEAAGCSRHFNTLSCLRALPFPKVHAAAETIPDVFGPQGVDISLLPRFDPNDEFFSESAEVSIQCGKFAKVPTIIGDQEDEGTVFALVRTNITSSEELVEHLMTYYPETERRILADLVSKYPNDPSAGSPFGTGNANQVYPQYKRLAAIVGDLAFQWPRRTYLSVASFQVPTWSYFSSYLYGTPFLGTFHSTDILALFEGGAGLISAEVVDSLQTHYISFINHLDPNTLSERVTAETVNRPREPMTQQVFINGDSDDSVSDNVNRIRNWPRYDELRKDMIDIGNHSNSIIRDKFREKAFKYYSRHIEDFRF